jgi:hypothetical protein
MVRLATGFKMRLPPVNSPCKVCQKKRARRFCPGVAGDICPVCCGTGRENTIDCPSDCEHLRESRLHERPLDVPQGQLPNSDIAVTNEFIEAHDSLIVLAGIELANAMERCKAVDSDAAEALDALIKSYRTLESGLIYEHRPANIYAAAIQADMKKFLEEMSRRVAERTGLHSLRDSEVLGVLVFWQRMRARHNNGRPRGRMFYDFLRQIGPSVASALAS